MKRELKQLRKALIASGRLDVSGSDDELDKAAIRLVTDFINYMTENRVPVPPTPPNMTKKDLMLAITAAALEKWTMTVLNSKYDPLRTETEH
jgi:hypothetical protein